MFLIKYILVFCAALLPTSVLCELEENFAVELNTDTFDNAIKENNYFVMFFAPWCGHCKRLHPLWEQLAEMLNVKEDAKVIISKVDCTQQKALCGEHDVTGYPTLRFFKLGEEGSVKFKGTRDLPAITDFITQQLGATTENEIETDEEEQKPLSKLVELTEGNFAKHVSSGNHFVKFYAPWCGHCQSLAPTWEHLSKSLQQQTAVQIAKVDCTVHRSICQDFDVKGYPTLLWIEDGKKIEKYSGSRSHDDLKAYVEKMLGGQTKSNDDVKIVESKSAQQDKDKVVVMTGPTFKDGIKSDVTFVKFYAPWCGHCQKLSPIWDQLATEIHNKNQKITIAKVDCTAAENKELCLEQQVEGYPTLFAYKNGEKMNEYDGSRSLDDLRTYIVKMVGHDEL